MGRVNKTGRRKGGPPFLQLHRYIMETEAWRSLSTQDRAVYLELLAIYNGSNNGFIGLGARTAAQRANVNKDTACKCLARLEERGFIECAQPGGFSTNDRRATEWRLTQHKCDRTGKIPSRAFREWRSKENRSPSKSDSTSPETGQSGVVVRLPVPSFRTMGAV